VPITDGTIRTNDLKQIKVDADDFGLMGYDPAFMNTASCRSAITYIDGDKGILRYRGYPIEQLAEKASFLEAELSEEKANHAASNQANQAQLERLQAQAKERIEKLRDDGQKLKSELGALEGELESTRERLRGVGDKPAKTEPEKPEKPAAKAAAKETAKPPTRTAAKPPEKEAAPAPAKTSGPWRIQLGAFSKRDSAEALFAKLSGNSALAGRQPFYVAAGAVTRLQVGPFASRAAATAACAALSRNGQPCFAVAAK
jgi:cell division septation protein DedD